MILSDHGCHSSVEPLFNFLQSIIDLTRIVELSLGQFHHPELIEILYKHMPKLYSLRITETMLTKSEMMNFHHIHSLTINDCLTNVDRMCSMFPYIKYLCLKLTTFEQMREMVKLLEKSLIHVTFRHINHDLQEQFIKWLWEFYGEHRRFSYDMDEHLNLHIWFSTTII